MATQVRLRRGNTVSHSTFTGALAEITVDTTKNTVVVHDGSTAGGFPLAKFSEITTANTSLKAYVDAAISSNVAAILDGSTFTGNLDLDTLTISNVSGVTSFYATNANGNITLIPNGNGVVDVTNSRISNVTDPLESQDAVTLSYLNTQLSAFSSSQLIADNTDITITDDGIASGSIHSNVDGTTITRLTATEVTIYKDIAITGNINPSANSVYSLGSISNQWKDLYVSNNTIYIGGASLTITDGNLIVNGVNQSGDIEFIRDNFANLSGATFTGIVNISNSSQTTGAGTGALQVAGGAYIDGNLYIGGNLDVHGNVIYFNTNNLTINDSLIYLADDNASDILDIGIVSAFTNPGYQHTGFVRDASDGYWKLFANVVAEPTTTVDFTNATYSNLLLGKLQSANVFSNTALITGNIQVGGLRTNGYFFANGAQIPIYSNTAVQTYLDNEYFGNIGVASNITPYSDVTYTLGSAAFQWAEVWVANTGLYIDSKTISVAGNTFLIDGNPIEAGSTYSNSNVASYLTVYGGNISINSLTAFSSNVTGNLIAGKLYANEFFYANGQSIFTNIDNAISALTANAGAQAGELATLTANAAAQAGAIAAAEGNITSANTAMKGYVDSLSYSSISNGLSNVAILASGGNITANVNGSLAATINVQTAQFTGNVIGKKFVWTDSSGNLYLGYNAGTSASGRDMIAIGDNAGYYTSSSTQFAVAIGKNAGSMGLGSFSVTVGSNSTSGGDNSVVLGYGVSTYSANSIVINATGGYFSPSTEGLFVQPITANASPGNLLYYNTTTKEITYGVSFASDIATLNSNAAVQAGAISDLYTIKANLAGAVFTGNVTAPNLTVTGTFTTNTFVTSGTQGQGNITGVNNLDAISITTTGNVTADWFVGNISSPATAGMYIGGNKVATVDDAVALAIALG